jgi:HD-GYP domain-containing protein (c-di-GMP phosphodiesterase class II)
LKGEHITRAARIFAVVDAWDALTTNRPYRKAWTRQAALEHIRTQSGIQFDPGVAAVFLKYIVDR